MRFLSTEDAVVLIFVVVGAVGLAVTKGPTWFGTKPAAVGPDTASSGPSSTLPKNLFSKPPTSPGWVVLSTRASCTYEYLDPVKRGDNGFLSTWLKRSCPKSVERVNGRDLQFQVRKFQISFRCDTELLEQGLVQYFDAEEANLLGEEDLSTSVRLGFITPTNVERPLLDRFCAGGGEPPRWVPLTAYDSCTAEYYEPVTKLNMALWVWERDKCTAEQQTEHPDVPGGTIRYFGILQRVYISCVAEREIRGAYREWLGKDGGRVYREIAKDALDLPLQASDLDPDDGDIIAPDHPSRAILNKYCTYNNAR